MLLVPADASRAASHSLRGLGHCCATVGHRTPSRRTYRTVLHSSFRTASKPCFAVSLSELRLCLSGSELRLCHSQSSGCVTRLRAQVVSLRLRAQAVSLRLYPSQSSGCVTLRAQELCESLGGRPELPVPNSPYSLCGRKSTVNDLNLAVSELRSCEKV